jgi:hypothetical protein
MPATEQSAIKHRSLGSILDHTKRLDAVYKSDLQLGDQLLVTTRNSVYSIHVLREGLYSVSGGWFENRGLSPSKVEITGCTWGGRAIKLDIVAACGLHLEFGNRVVTSRILDCRVIRCRENSIH